MSANHPSVPDAQELYVYSREDYGRILGDAFVDIREVGARR